MQSSIVSHHLKNKLKTNPLTIRPDYLRLSPLPPCHVIDKIQEELSKKHEVEGRTQGDNATLYIPKRKADFWSPVFDIHVNKRGKGSTIKGVVGPNPKIWAFFIFFIALALILFFLGLLMAIYQWMFSMESPLTWSIPSGLVLAFLAFIMAKIGQYKSKDQMTQLWHFFEQAMDEREKKQRDLLEELFPGEDIKI